MYRQKTLIMLIFFLYMYTLFTLHVNNIAICLILYYSCQISILKRIVWFYDYSLNQLNYLNLMD